MTTTRERTLRVAAAVVDSLGSDRVVDDPAALVKMSSDWSKMSPVLQEKIPAGRYVADVVVCPRTAEEVATVLRLAYDADVPVTPRGAGTGNYGQATPFDGGIVLDLRALDRIRVNADGSVTAGAGARLTEIDKVARAAGRDIWIFPSTKGSTIGGFVGGGSAGTGTIEHGTTSDGFVRALIVAPMDGSGDVLTFRGDEAAPYIHAYGVTGIVVEVEIATDPARDWTAVYAGFDSWDQLIAVHSTLLDLPVLPRLASGDEPALVPTLPARVRLDPAQHSLRVIAESSTVAEIARRVEAAGGTVVATLDDYAATDRLSGMSYNHPVYFLQQGHPERTWFHMETGSPLYWTDAAKVREVYPGEVYLHLELMGTAPLAMLVADYVGEDEVLAGIPRLDALGVGVHSPHQWYVDRNVDLVREVAARRDPKGLLNPGKLVADAPLDTRVNIGVR
ncbi:FAD-binding oxidoreductase [Nocardioides sp. KR10-350]|uniref:FAD-binding oxidoreductase n=1 Tax=Nocardioides cheoyonin TaxID=3156615 RepID=UPI0032B36A7B